MTVRGCAAAWALAVLTSIVAVVTFAAVGRSSERGLSESITAPVVAIGSSLLRHSVSSRSTASASLLGNGEAHVRLALDNITEQEGVGLLRSAIDLGAKTILVEANPFVFDFRDKTPEHAAKETPSAWLGVQQRWFGERARSGLKNLLGVVQPPAALAEPPDLNQGTRISAAKLATIYPLAIHEPRQGEALQELVALARSRGVTMVLLFPPRSQTAASFMGETAIRQLEDHVHRVANRLGLPLFSPASAWPDSYFIDQGHMNWRGRSRFQGELASWWASRA